MIRILWLLFVKAKVQERFPYHNRVKKLGRKDRVQAVIITAYHNLQQTYELASMLAKKFEIYIHIDKKIPKKEIEQSGLYKIKNIKIFNKFKVYWGGGQIIFGVFYI